MKPTRVVLCDLDDTLFDHTGASLGALAALQEEEPVFGRWTLDELATRYGRILERIHVEVMMGRMTPEVARRTRLTMLFTEAGATDDFHARIPSLAVRYRANYEASWRAVTGAVALLDALAAAGVPVAAVTNNLEEEQRAKLGRLGLTGHLAALVTTDQVGVSKPEPGMFLAALERLGAAADEAVMLGDGWASDVVGARQAGIRAVWLNRHGVPSPDPSVAELRALEPTAAALAAVLGRSVGEAAAPAARGD